VTAIYSLKARGAGTQDDFFAAPSRASWIPDDAQAHFFGTAQDTADDLPGSIKDTPVVA
jgi:hypothetical protein